MNALASWLTRAVRGIIIALDLLLRRLQDVYEFTNDADCILRLALSRNHRERMLSDGTVVRAGDLVVELHFWNEHIPRMGREGPDLAWGLTFYRRLRHSLQELARYVEQTPALQNVVAFYGETSIAFDIHGQRYGEVLRRLGFDFVPLPPTHIWQRIGHFFQHLYVWALIWTFNPVSLKRKDLFAAQRGEMWISRQRLMERYGCEERNYG